MLFERGAVEKARKLVESCLTKEELKIVKDTGELPISTPLGTFIVKGFSHKEDIPPVANILGSDGTVYCARLNRELPRHDHLAAQILWLKTDPEGFFRVANAFPPEGQQLRRPMPVAYRVDPRAAELLTWHAFAERLKRKFGQEWELIVRETVDPFEEYQRFILKNSETHYSLTIGVAVRTLFGPGMSQLQLQVYLEREFQRGIEQHVIGQQDYDVNIYADDTVGWSV